MSDWRYDSDGDASETGELSLEDILAFRDEAEDEDEDEYDDVDDAESSALIDAINANDIKEVTRLLDEGANIDEVVEYQSPLYAATLLQDTLILELLLERGANVNLVITFRSKTALSTAIWNSRYNHAKLLLQHGANIDTCDGEGLTPLHIIAMHPLDYDEVQFLLDNGANPNSIDNRAQTPLHLAAKAHSIHNAKKLIEYRADIMRLDTNNKTPFDYLYDETLRQELLDYAAELERQREQERLYTMLVLEQQRDPYFAIEDIGSIVTAYLR